MMFKTKEIIDEKKRFQRQSNMLRQWWNSNTDYQFRFWRTRRMASLGFLRTTIHNMMEVAKDRPYLESMSPVIDWGKETLDRSNLPSEDVLRMIVSQIDLCGAANRDTLGLAVIRLNQVGDWEQISLSAIRVLAKYLIQFPYPLSAQSKQPDCQSTQPFG